MGRVPSACDDWASVAVHRCDARTREDSRAGYAPPCAHPSPRPLHSYTMEDGCKNQCHDEFVMHGVGTGECHAGWFSKCDDQGDIIEFHGGCSDGDCNDCAYHLEVHACEFLRMRETWDKPDDHDEGHCLHIHSEKDDVEPCVDAGRGGSVWQSPCILAHVLARS